MRISAMQKQRMRFVNLVANASIIQRRLIIRHNLKRAQNLFKNSDFF
ncbi:MAG: hypothetical protein ACI8ZM_001439 [Crocinitomix sp.]|jgi:hypothetical protein